MPGLETPPSGHAGPTFALESRTRSLRAVRIRVSFDPGVIGLGESTLVDPLDRRHGLGNEAGRQVLYFEETATRRRNYGCNGCWTLAQAKGRP